MSQGPLVKEFRKYAWDHFIPLNATIELSVSCNFKCLHCYNFDRNTVLSPEIKKNELTKEEVFNSIKKLKELGSIYIAFTGGEPLLHPHLDEYIKKAKEEGFIVRLKSNGLMMSVERSKQLKDLGLEMIDISVYGGSESSYKSLTQVSGAFNKVFEAIGNAKNAGLDVNANIVIHKENYKELPSIIRTLEKMGVSYGHSDEITERYTDNKNSPKLVELDGDDYEYIFSNDELRDYFMVKNEDFAPQCACARTNIGLSSQGDIYPCIGAPIKAGNIRESDLIDIWKNSDVFNNIRGLKMNNFSSCVKCDVKKFCQRSSGAVYANTGDYTGCDESSLRLAKIRARYS